MYKTESTVRKMLTAIEAPLNDIGVVFDIIWGSGSLLVKRWQNRGRRCCFEGAKRGAITDEVAISADLCVLLLSSLPLFIKIEPEPNSSKILRQTISKVTRCPQSDSSSTRSRSRRTR
jgi:hypothetical protein